MHRLFSRRATTASTTTLLSEQLPAAISPPLPHRLAFAQKPARRALRATRSRPVVKPFLLADIGEGITEVQIIQWFVQAGARVEQFDRLCEVQSDKASVEITSRFDGVIKKLHYDADDMAVVGKPLVDIDVQGDAAAELEAQAGEDGGENASATKAEEGSGTSGGEARDDQASAGRTSTEELERPRTSTGTGQSGRSGGAATKGKSATLATPAIRHLVKVHDVDIADVQGTGRDGRVLKEDVQKYVSLRSSESQPNTDTGAGAGAEAEAEALTSQQQALPGASPSDAEIQPDRTVALTPTQNAMFKSMTRSLAIPHFLYSDTVDVGALHDLRRSLNASYAAESAQKETPPRLTLLPFLLKAVSLTLTQFPILNARVSASADDATGPSRARPQLTFRGSHNITIAVDTPSGLLVPVVRAVQSHSIASLSVEIARLSALARAGRLATSDLSGGTFAVTNVGSIGGGVVAPVLVEGTVGILGVGRAKVVPAFNDKGEVVRREECVVSWSADHRVVDGATVARAGEFLRVLLEQPGRMMVGLR